MWFDGYTVTVKFNAKAFDWSRFYGDFARFELYMEVPRRLVTSGSCCCAVCSACYHEHRAAGE